MAVSFAALLNCEQPVRPNNGDGHTVPCGKCRNCRNVFGLHFEGLHFAVPIPPHENKLDKAIDLTNEFLEAKREEPFVIVSSTASTNIPVAIAREIKRQLSMKSGEEIRRVVIFYQMERMLASSADALLKMIEEPPADTTIVLITVNPDSLLPTIQSRSQRIKVSPFSTAAIEGYLSERYDLTDSRTKLVARIAEGSVGRAVDAIEGTDDETSQRGIALLLFKSLFLDNGADTLAHMNDVLNLRDRSESEELLRLWQLLIRDCAGAAVSGDDEDIVNVDFRPDVRKLSRYFNAPGLSVRMVDDIKNTLADLRLNVHIQGALMALALRLKAHIRAAN
jgi:DNA polymerase-3 subunit delta'